MRILQEKNQFTEPDESESHSWADFDAQRRVDVNRDTTQSLNIPSMVKSAVAPPSMQMSHNNVMPVGMFGEDDNFGRVTLAGATDASNHVDGSALARGYLSYEMSADKFSNDCESSLDQSVGGFEPRANYLDRE